MPAALTLAPGLTQDPAATGPGAVLLLGLLLAYLLGAVPFGLVMVRLIKGIDLRDVGSGNIGATNAMRVLGKPLGLLAFLLDFAKGYVSVALLAPLFESGPPDDLWRTAFGAAAVLGHVFPIYLRFKGGKAVATGAGALVGIDPLIFLGAGLVWLATLGVSRMVACASLAMGAAFPCVAAWRITAGAWYGWPVVFGAAGLTLLIFVRHRANFARILAGTEPRIGGPKLEPGAEPSPGSDETSA